MIKIATLCWREVPKINYCHDRKHWQCREKILKRIFALFFSVLL